MKNYPIVAVLWNDPHIILRESLPDNDIPDFINPTLTVGLLYKKTKDFIVVLHNIERSARGDEADYTLIFNGCLISIEEKGTLKLRKLSPRGSVNG